jgi:hypothetical protein
MSGVVRWKLEDREGGEPKIPEPKDYSGEGNRESALYSGSYKELDDLKEALRPGIWARLEEIMAWSRPNWVSESFQRVQTDIEVWAELGVRPEEKEDEEEEEQKEALAGISQEGEEKVEAEIIEGIPGDIIGNIKKLEKLGVVVPGVQASYSDLTLAKLRRKASLEHLREIVIVGVQFTSAEGKIFESEEDYGSPWEVEQSPLGFNQWYEEITYLMWQLEILKAKHRDERAGNFRESLSGASSEKEFRKNIYRQLSLLWPTLEREMQDMMGADMPEDLRQAILARTEGEKQDHILKLPLTEKLAKKLRKGIPGIEDVAGKNAFIMVVRDESQLRPVPQVAEVREGEGHGGR